MAHNTLNNQINQNNVSVAQMRNRDEGHAAAVHLADFYVANVSCSCMLDKNSPETPIESALLRQQQEYSYWK